MYAYRLCASLILITNIGHDHSDNIDNLPEEHIVEVSSTLRISNINKIPSHTF